MNIQKKKTIIGLKTQNDKYPVNFIGNYSNESLRVYIKCEC